MSDTTDQGIFSLLLPSLVTPVPILLSLVLIALSIFLAVFGTRSLLWLRLWGRTIGIKEKMGWIPGGIGGVVGGFLVFGYFCAFLIAFIVDKTGSTTLSGGSTLVILTVPTPIGGYLFSRRQWCARTSFGILGSLSLTLLFAVSFNLTSVLYRLIIFLVLLGLSLLFIHLPYPKLRLSISLFTGFTSSLLFITALDLFLKVGFLDAIGLLVASNGVGAKGSLGTTAVESGGAEKGLIAAWWLIGIFSAVGQGWWNWKDSGEGDETWNDYLSTYSQTYASSNGTFYPPTNILSRWFKSSPSPARSHRSPLTNLPSPSRLSRRSKNPWDQERGEPEKTDTWNSDSDLEDAEEICVKKPHRYNGTNGMSSEEEVEGLMQDKYDQINVRIGVKGDEESLSGLSGSTLVSEKVTKVKKERTAKEEEENEDLLASLPTLSKDGNKKKKFFNSLVGGGKSSKPAQYAPSSASSVTSPASPKSEFIDTSLTPSSFSSKSAKFAASPPQSPTTASGPSATHHVVPATPSLLNAINRVQEAQKEARRGRKELELPKDGRRKGSMDDWWKKVVEKGKE